MAPSAPTRRLTTVLFLDIVGSTEVASGMGDARWHTLLSSFRREIRAQLRDNKGHEENFTGDGIVATFSEPELAIRGALKIARSVQELGVDVRGGLHTGQVETIEGQLGGVAVHIGARVMALAGDAEILTTRTTRDLVQGTDVVFGERTVHTLKGVEGSWELAPVRSIGALAAPAPLDPETAGARQGAIEPASRRTKRLAISAVAAVLVVVALAGWLLTRQSASPPSGPLSLVKLDGGGSHVIQQVEDGMLTDHLWGALTVQNGTLYQRTPTELRIRDLETGIVARPPFSVDRNDVSAIGFGSEWLGRNEDRDSIQRVDLVSGTVVGSIDVPGGAPVLAVGPDAVWFVTRTGDLGRLDPVSMQVQRWPSGALKPGAVVPFRDYVWVCDCDNRQIFRFDIATQQFQRFDIPEKAYLLGPTDGSSASQLWLVDEAAGAITELDPVSGQRGRAHGFTGVIADAEIGLGKIWIAAADHVYVLDANDEMTDIPMPPGFFASSVAVDTADETVWIGTCGCPLDEA